MTQNEWPHNFDLRDTPETGERIHSFIDKYLQELKSFDEKREAWVKENLPPDYKITYFFHDHTLRVANDIKKTALHMGLSELTATNLYYAMLPHDIGKVRLPLDLWDMVEKPEEDIKAKRRNHTILGTEIVEEELHDIDHPFKDLMLDIMRHHHENMDGSGFLGLTGDKLSAPVRLACIVESFDGYSITRPHFGDRDVSIEGVITRMRDEKGSDIYDMKLFEAFAGMKTKEASE